MVLPWWAFQEASYTDTYCNKEWSVNLLVSHDLFTKFTGIELGFSFQVCPVFGVMASLVLSTLILIVFAGLIVDPF